MASTCGKKKGRMGFGEENTKMDRNMHAEKK
jgi:hypothetical protein